MLWPDRTGPVPAIGVCQTRGWRHHSYPTPPVAEIQGVALFLVDRPLKAAAPPRPLIDAMALRLERPHIHVIVPGHNGSELRRQTLLENMRSLTKASLDITCTLYAYAPVQDVSPCVTVNHVGFWMQHLHGDEAVKLHRIYAADYVMIMIDSVALRSVDVRQLTLVMAWNCIDMAGPSCPSCESKQLIAPDSRYNTSHRSGRRVAFIDHQITLLTPAAFACQRRLAHHRARHRRARLVDRKVHPGVLQPPRGHL